MKLKNFMLEKEQEKEEEIDGKIIDFLRDNPAPPDEKIHDMSDKLGIETDEFEAMIYKLLGAVIGHGKAKEAGVTEEDVDPEQLQMGIKAEMEHTNNKAIAKRIAIDHLVEIKDYYTRLAKMESEAGIKEEKTCPPGQQW